jgi:hypothetical protein
MKMSKTTEEIIKELLDALERAKKDKEVAENNVKWLKSLAEKSGSEVAVWKHEALRSRDIIRQLENENKLFKERNEVKR